jgi:hypothetical protein
MARTSIRWLVLTAAGVTMSVVSVAAMIAGTRWMITHRAGSSYTCLHYGAIGRGTEASSPTTASPWSMDAWTAVRLDAGSIVWMPETTGFANGEVRWFPLWPGIPCGLALAGASLLHQRRRHWTHCRGCGYRRVGLTYDLPCPECGVVPRRWRP